MSALWTNAEIEAATGGVASAPFEVTGVTFDSREVGAGDLFVAMPGTASDGHAFVTQAFASGASAALVSKPVDGPHVEGKLITVFGAGGDRDKGKRAPMGAVAARLSDVAIVTDDNPRGEDPAAIRAEVLGGAPGATEIGDRRAAIAEAIRVAGPGDIVLIAGKGHETGQIIGAGKYQRVLPFDDVLVARECAA